MSDPKALGKLESRAEDNCITQPSLGRNADSIPKQKLKEKSKQTLAFLKESQKRV